MTNEIKLLNKTVEQVKALYLEQAKIKAQIDALEETLKNYLTENNQTLLTVDAGTVSYKEIVSRTLNTTELKKSEFAFIYDKFLNEKVTMRFKVA